MAEFQVDYAAPVERITLSGLSTLPDGHVTVAGERVLAYGPAGIDVGIWIVVSGGAWTRATDFDSSAEVVWNAKIYPDKGEHAGAEFYVGTTGTITPGTTPFTIYQRTYPQVQTPGAGFEKVLNDWRLTTTGILPGSYDRATFDAYGRAYAVSAAEPATTFREGLRLVYNSANALTIEEGAAYVPGVGDIVDLALDEPITGMTLTANTFYYLYLYSDAGEGAIEYSTQRPTSPYRGRARVKGGPDNVDPDVSPDDTKAYIGTIRGSSTANTMVRFIHRGDWIFYQADPAALTTAGGLKIANALGGTAYTARDASALVPPTSDLAEALFLTNGSSAVEVNLDPTGAANLNWVVVKAAGAGTGIMRLTSTQTFLSRNSAGGGSTDVAILSYLMER